MHLLYLDDSGSVSNPQEDYVVLGGISVFETQAYHLANDLDKLAQSIDPSNPSKIEFHASEIYSRRTPPWNKFSQDEARGIIKSILKILANSSNSTYAFACSVHKSSYSEDGLYLAFEDLCQRFDTYLKKINIEGDNQRGLLILDDSSHETILQELAQNFRKTGTQWGKNVRYLADTPFFVNSKASRIIQLADHIAYAVFRRYNTGDTQYFDIIAHKFYQQDGIIHGLAHKHKTNQPCMCLACMSRKFNKEIPTQSF